jgi:hypothetical protein
VDLDGDNVVEVFFGGPQEYYGYRLDGALLSGWPVSATYRLVGVVFAPCAIGDLDGDGTFEVVGASDLGEISVWSDAGELLPGWPKQLPKVPRPRVAVKPSVFGSAALGDLDRDGNLEIVIASANGLLHVFRPDGTVFPGFPFDLDAGQARFADPALADVDGDGVLEIIVAAQGQRPRELHPPVHVIRADGSEQPGFPRPVDFNINDGVAIADLDGDGQLWIIAAVDSNTETIHVWNARTGDVRQGFPVAHGFGRGAWASPTVADITGDGKPEILQSQSFEGATNARLFAWDRHGRRVSPFPMAIFPGDSVTFSAPTLADFNDNGLIDVLPAEYTFGFSGPSPGRLHALSLGQPFDARTLEWPMDSHDVRHTGLYEPPVDELRIRGHFTEDFVFLHEPPGRLTGKVWFVDQRRDLAGAMASGGVRIGEINDRPIGYLPGRILATPGLRGLGASVNRPDLVVQFDGRVVAAAILERLRRAGVQGSEERNVRLKLESPLQDRRRIGGEIRLRVKMPVGG